MGNTEHSIPRPARAVGAALTATAVGGVAAVLLLGPSASAAPDPCAASSVARTIGTVANNTGVYLDTHPETNSALTRISRQPAGPQSLVALKTYFDGNPDAAKDMQDIQKPLTTLANKCDLPISLPQVMGLMQAAQGADLPGAAQAVSGAATGAAGTGPAPGPAAPKPVPKPAAAAAAQ